MVFTNPFLDRLENFNFFRPKNFKEVSFFEIPETGKIFLILFLSYQLNFVDKYIANYYFRNAKLIQNSFRIPGHLLLIPSDSSFQKFALKNEILKVAQSFKSLLESKIITISEYQSKLLEKAYISFLLEKF